MKENKHTHTHTHTHTHAERRATNESSSQTNHQNVRCGICRKTIRTNRGLLQHLNICRHQNSDLHQTIIKPEVQNDHIYGEGHNDGDQEKF